MVGCGAPGDWLVPDLSSMSTLHDFVSWMRRILYFRNPQGGSSNSIKNKFLDGSTYNGR